MESAILDGGAGAFLIPFDLKRDHRHRGAGASFLSGKKSVTNAF
jgi:hypothetical protein